MTKKSTDTLVEQFPWGIEGDNGLIGDGGTSCLEGWGGLGVTEGYGGLPEGWM